MSAIRWHRTLLMQAVLMRRLTYQHKFGMTVDILVTYNKGCSEESSLCESFDKKLRMLKYRQHATCERMSDTLCQCTMEIDYSLHCNQTTDLSFQVHVSWGGGLPWQEKGCSELKSIFVSVWRG